MKFRINDVYSCSKEKKHMQAYIIFKKQFFQETVSNGEVSICNGKARLVALLRVVTGTHMERNHNFYGDKLKIKNKN